MKRKKFQKPEATVTRFNAVDIVTASSDSAQESNPKDINVDPAPIARPGSSAIMR